MKLVKEYINEKFVEDSDPIHDMGIGISAVIKKIKNAIAKRDWVGINDVNDEDVIRYCYESLKNKETALSVVKYILSSSTELSERQLKSLFREVIYFSKKDGRRIEIINIFLNTVLSLTSSRFKDVQESPAYSVTKEEINKIYDLFYDIALKTKNIKVINTLIPICAKNNDIDKVKELIANGGNPAKSNHRALQYAIRNKNKEMVNLLWPYFNDEIS